MRRSRFICWGLVALVCALSGCGTVGRMNPIAGFRRSAEKERQLARSNPFRRNGVEEAADLDAADEPRDQRTLDAETKQFIADELADATPAERERLTADLQSLDPVTIKQVLKLRRMRLEIDRQQPSSSDVSQAAATGSYQGLGAAFPGTGSHSPPTHLAAQTQPQTRSPETSFGHSGSRSRERSPNEARPPLRERAFHVPSSPDQPPPDASQNLAADSGTVGDVLNRLPVQSVAFNAAAAERPQPAADGRTLNLLPDAAHQRTGVIQPDRPTPAAASSFNPLQFAGIETSPAEQPPTTGPSAAPDQPVAPPSPWGNAMQQMIAAAEEQAYAAQTAWEQADQLAAGNSADDAARRELIAARRQDFVEKQVHLRMLYLMSGQQARALERIRGLEPADQEFWTQVMWSLANYFDVEGMPNGDDRATQTIVQLRAAIQHLQQAAKLRVRNVDFCKTISSFGNYETFENDLFRPGQPVMVYAEIENFASERGSDGLYRTQLKSTIEIHKVTPTGSNVIKTIEFDATTDLCRNHRRDYYHSYELQVPAAATSGSYSLVLLVEDQLSRRVATYSRNFTVE